MFGFDDATRQAAAHHEDILFGDLAFVAVVLLINAVELQKLVVIVGKTIQRGVGEGRANGARQRGARLFKPFVASEFDRCRRFNHKLYTYIT